MRFSRNAALLVAVAACSLLSQPTVQAADLLTIGSKAPALDVEHWIHKDNGFAPVSKFEDGKVYVVEFWATWCGPCVASMPHLASLQKEMKDKGVRIISISDEDLETVDRFLDREVRGAEPKAEGETPPTYRELTSAYSLTTDPDQSSYTDYMEAAAQNGIPTAFIVGKDAKIEWIGHPMEMDGPLQAVVSGSWDREAFAKEIKARQEAEKAMQDIFALLQEQKFDEAVKLIDEITAKSDNLQLKMLKLQVLIAGEKTDAAAEHLAAVLKELGDQPETINMITWNIYEMASQGTVEKGALVDTALTATQDAIKKSEGEEKASLLDTLAHLYAANDEIDKAIAAETEAAKLSGDRDREFIEGFLKELQELKAAPQEEK